MYFLLYISPKNKKVESNSLHLFDNHLGSKGSTDKIQLFKSWTEHPVDAAARVMLFDAKWPRLFAIIRVLWSSRIFASRRARIRNAAFLSAPFAPSPTRFLRQDQQEKIVFYRVKEYYSTSRIKAGLRWNNQKLNWTPSDKVAFKQRSRG